MPGIGNSMAAGSYLLYQLLHYDAEKIQLVFHCFDGRGEYVSDKTTQTVREYAGGKASKEFLYDLWNCGIKVYYLRCGKVKNAARGIFFAWPRLGHDCGAIPK
ncbi:putative retrotransposon hot spot (RHS) protein, partial [Trypanosoma cruzi]